jgi:N-acetylneuraminic acid mutarotase
MDRPEGGWESLDPKALAKDFSTVEVYDPATDTWTARADMPTPRSHMTVSAVGGKIYAIGGGIPPRTTGTGQFHPLLEVYDTATNRWSRAAADLPTPRSVLSSCVVDGRIYVMGGIFSRGSSLPEIVRNLQILSVVEVYDPVSGRWTRGRDLGAPRGWFSTSTMNGKIYVVGGRSPGPNGETMENVTFPGVEVYTPAP